MQDSSAICYAACHGRLVQQLVVKQIAEGSACGRGQAKPLALCGVCERRRRQVWACLQQRFTDLRIVRPV